MSWSTVRVEISPLASSGTLYFSASSLRSSGSISERSIFFNSSISKPSGRIDVSNPSGIWIGAVERPGAFFGDAVLFNSSLIIALKSGSAILPVITISPLPSTTYLTSEMRSSAYSASVLYLPAFLRIFSLYLFRSISPEKEPLVRNPLTV